MLYDWQKITRVLPGKPFGKGTDGDINYSGGNLGGLPGVGYAIFSASAGATNFNITDRYYFNGGNGGRVGDIVLLHQTWGSGAGQWEINQIVARSGSNITLAKPLKYSYSNGQIISSGQYKNFTVSGSITARAWDGVGFGIVFLVVKELLTINSNINASYKGFRGGSRAGQNDNSYAYAGEGYNGGYNSLRTRSNNANGGGGGRNETNSNAQHGGGGGGGNAFAGSNGLNYGGSSSSNAGLGGSPAGNQELNNIEFGGGGGGPGVNWEEPLSPSKGGNGGGIVIIYSKNIIFNNSILSNGENGGPNPSSNSCGSGGGAGGSVLINCEATSVSSNSIKTLNGAGSPGVANSNGGNGSKGRIAIYYGKSLSGSISSSNYGTYYTHQDLSLIERAEGGSFLYNLL